MILITDLLLVKVVAIAIIIFLWTFGVILIRLGFFYWHGQHDDELELSARVNYKFFRFLIDGGDGLV